MKMFVIRLLQIGYEAIISGGMYRNISIFSDSIIRPFAWLMRSGARISANNRLTYSNSLVCEVINSKYFVVI